MTTPEAFYDALQRCDLQEFVRLMGVHPDHIQTEQDRVSWLHSAAFNGKIPFVEFFIRQGVDVNASKDDDPEGAVVRAAEEGHLEVVRCLLDHGANINHVVNGKTRCFALTGAIVEGHFDVVRLLVERGADVNANWRGMTPLTFALSYGQEEIADYLRSVGAKEPHELDKPDLPQDHAAIVKHFEKHRNQTASPLALHEVLSGDPPIAICVIPPSPGWEGQTLFTVGMSDRPLSPTGDSQPFAELAIYLPTDWPLTQDALAIPDWSWPITWLRRIARYPHEGGSWPSGVSVIFANEEPPRPLAPNTKLTCLMCLADPGDFGQIKLPDHRLVQVYSIYPLYTEERDLERREGTMHLIELFQKHGIGRTVSVSRLNVATLPGR